MKKILLLSLILIFIIACNIPQGVPTESNELLGTAVGLTLTAQVGLFPERTVTAATNEDKPESNTPYPKQTETPTTTPTIKPSDTPMPTLTVTPTGGPASSLGEADWKTSFEGGRSSFYDEDDENTTIEAKNGALVLTSSLKNPGWHTWSMHYHKIKNFYLQADINIRLCSGVDEYGVVFRAPDYNHGYFFGMKCNGKYSLQYLADDYVPIIDWKNTDAIHSGSDQHNRLGVMVNENNISLYINDKKVDETIDSSNNAEGMFGVYIAAYNTPGFTIELDDIAYWILNH